MTSFVCINCIDDRHSLVFTKNTDILKTSKEAKGQTDCEDTTCSTKVCVRRSVMIPVISPFNIHHSPDNSSEQRKSPSDHIHIQAFSRSVLCPFLLLRWNRQLGPHPTAMVCHDIAVTQWQVVQGVVWKQNVL